VSGMLSGVFVVTANAWMNTPTGFKIVDGKVTDVDPIAAMLNPASLQQVIHMTIAAYLATALAVCAVHAFFLRRNRHSRFHRRALQIGLGVVVVAAPLQFLSGDFIARMVAKRQPAKFAAMEAHYRSEAGAALVLGGIPNDEQMAVPYAIRLPRLLSLMAHHDANAKVTGLEEIPRNEWPNTRLVHWAFDVMVVCGVVILFVAVWAGVSWLRRHSVPHSKWLLGALVATGPLGFIAIEAGWCVTELGRQPWIIYGVMRTEEAVTPMKGLVVPFVLFTGVYVFLSLVLVHLLRRQFTETNPKRAASKFEESHAE